MVALADASAEVRSRVETIPPITPGATAPRVGMTVGAVYCAHEHLPHSNAAIHNSDRRHGQG